jgi:hypothetical protein
MPCTAHHSHNPDADDVQVSLHADDGDVQVSLHPNGMHLATPAAQCVLDTFNQPVKEIQ